MFITPYFGGCKYTNNFLFINKNIEFQYFGLLITSARRLFSRLVHHTLLQQQSQPQKRRRINGYTSAGYAICVPHKGEHAGGINH